MTDAILTVNAGASSLKIALFGLEGETPLRDTVNRIGPQGRMTRRAIRAIRDRRPGPWEDEGGAILSRR